MNPSAKQFLEVLLRQKNLILGTIAIAVVGTMVAFKFVPKKYKVQTTISIQTQYFQVPLVRDFMPETFDGGELRSQREAILRRALDHKYLLDLGKRYQLFGKMSDDAIKTADLEDLSHRFEIVPAGPTSFLIGFFSPSPEAGYNVLVDIIGHIKQTLAQERRTTLLRLHDAIEEQLESLSAGGRQVVGDPTDRDMRPELVKKEIDRLESELSALKTTYSPRHPKIAELSKRLETLQKWLVVNPEVEAARKVRSLNFSGSKVDPASKELFEEMLKKYHYLEVAIYLDEQSRDTYMSILQEPYVPRAPLWPKRPVFLIWAVVVGFFVGALLALMREIVPAGSMRRIRLAVVARSESSSPMRSELTH